MNVYLTFDVEIWCDGWNDLDARFPAAFERYVYGRSARGDFALPKTLEILERHGLTGVFFVEPLFSARFGERYLREIVELIDAAGQDVQLHIHPEWTDEIQPSLIADAAVKRQHLCFYTQAEQATLIGWGKQALERILGRSVTAFRAGSYAADRATFAALEIAGIPIDSSLNDCYAVSGADLPDATRRCARRQVGQVVSYPVTVFTDGFGRRRPAQLNGCGFAELRDALFSAARGGSQHFVIVSHNFELLKPGSSEPDPIVVKRFEQLCALLRDHPDEFQVGSFGVGVDSELPQAASVGMLSTARRHAEQIIRRIA